MFQILSTSYGLVANMLVSIEPFHHLRKFLRWYSFTETVNARDSLPGRILLSFTGGLTLPWNPFNCFH